MRCMPVMPLSSVMWHLRHCGRYAQVLRSLRSWKSASSNGLPPSTSQWGLLQRSGACSRAVRSLPSTSSAPVTLASALRFLLHALQILRRLVPPHQLEGCRWLRAHLRTVIVRRFPRHQHQQAVGHLLRAGGAFPVFLRVGLVLLGRGAPFACVRGRAVLAAGTSDGAPILALALAGELGHGLLLRATFAALDIHLVEDWSDCTPCVRSTRSTRGVFCAQTPPPVRCIPLHRGDRARCVPPLCRKTQAWAMRRFAFNEHSQNGEDGIIFEMLDRLGSGRDRWCCEFGAWDGKHLSNTFRLVQRERYSAVYIEPDRERFQELEKTAVEYPEIIPLDTEVSADNLDSILATTAIPRDFDLLSIDVDGPDYQIWQGLQEYRPKIVIIEVESSWRPGTFVVHDPASSVAGSSFSSMLELARSKSYTLVCHTGNMVFVVGELAELMETPAAPEDAFDAGWAGP